MTRPEVLPRLHLLIGPVGAGKSTVAARLQHRHSAVHLDLDAWMARLYGPDERPEDRMAWYLERTDRCLDLLWELIGQLVDAGTSSVLELGLIRRKDRDAFYRRVDAAGYALAVYVVDAPREVRRTRVEQRNRERGATWSMDVPSEIFELASDLWEPPGAEERAERGILEL